MSNEDNNVAATLARVRAQLAAALPGGHTDLATIEEAIGALARHLHVDDLLWRRLAAVRDTLGSHVLAAHELELAGLPPHRCRAVLEAGRRTAIEELQRVEEAASLPS